MTFGFHYDIIIMGSERGDKMPEKKKIGRPTDSPKRHEIKVRFDDETLHILDEYCLKENVTRVQGIRDGVKCLKNK